MSLLGRPVSNDAGGLISLSRGQVRAERGRDRTGRPVFDDTADRGRIARPEAIRRLTRDELDGRRIALEHQRFQVL